MNTLTMVDVSGSMSCSAGSNDSLTCMDVAISLGIYISERNEGTFKDSFLQNIASIIRYYIIQYRN